MAEQAPAADAVGAFCLFLCPWPRGSGAAFGRNMSRNAYVLAVLLLGGCARPASESCYTPLLQIEGAKESWMQEKRQTTNDTPTWEDLAGFFRSVPLRCPDGGTYAIGRIGELPTCSIQGHSDYLREHHH